MQKKEIDKDLPGTVKWCLENKDGLSFQMFADHFNFTDKTFSYNIYKNI